MLKVWYKSNKAFGFSLYDLTTILSSPQWDFLYWQDDIFILNRGPHHSKWSNKNISDILSKLSYIFLSNYSKSTMTRTNLISYSGFSRYTWKVHCMTPFFLLAMHFLYKTAKIYSSLQWQKPRWRPHDSILILEHWLRIKQKHFPKKLLINITLFPCIVIPVFKVTHLPKDVMIGVVLSRVFWFSSLQKFLDVKRRLCWPGSKC